MALISLSETLPLPRVAVGVDRCVAGDLRRSSAWAPGKPGHRRHGLG